MNILCYDPQGIFVQQAAGLSNNGKNIVKYSTFWEADQKFSYESPGRGVKGLEKVMYPDDYIEKSDCIINFDCTSQDFISYLRRTYPKKSIYGAGQASKLENDRWGFKKIVKEIGLPVHKAVKVKGVTDLRKFLKENKDKYIKINTFRGDVESFYSKDLESVDLIIDEISSSFGPFKDEFEFVVEDAIHTDVEIGVDTFFNGVDYLKPYFYGYEWKKMLYVAKVSETLPPQLEETMSKLKPVLQKLDYRAALSTEEKIVSKKEHYFIDITCRLPSPLCALYPEYILNWPEVVYKIGCKQPVRLSVKHKYIAALPLNSHHGSDHWLKIDVKETDRDHIKLYRYAQIGNKYYNVKGSEKVGVIVAGGNSVDEVLDIIKSYANKIDALGIEKDGIYGIDHIKEIIKNGEKLGINF